MHKADVRQVITGSIKGNDVERFFVLCETIAKAAAKGQQDHADIQLFSHWGWVDRFSEFTKGIGKMGVMKL